MDILAVIFFIEIHVGQCNYSLIICLKLSQIRKYSLLIVNHHNIWSNNGSMVKIII